MRCLVVLVLFTAPALAQAPYHETARLTPADLGQPARFGWSVALDGDTLAVGAHTEPGGGAVYVFRRTGPLWLLESRLQRAGSAGLGIAVALAGDRLVAGDIGAGNGTTHTYGGGAFVFDRSGTIWTETAQLFASDGLDGHEFGRALSIDGARLLIGAPRGGQSAHGAAYVFHWDGTTWSQEARLAASDLGATDQFGTSVGLDGDTAIVGVPLKSSQLGAAYVFVKSAGTWSQQARLNAAGGVAPLQFGAAVAVAGDRAFVGAPRDSLAALETGSVRVFGRAGSVWTESAALVPLDAGPTIFTAQFGAALALDGARLAIGAPVDYTLGGPAAGSVYVFSDAGGSWAQEAKLLTRDRWIFDWFGSSVALQGDTVVGGAYSDDGQPGATGSSDNGSARVFELFPATGTTYCVGTTAACPCAQDAGVGVLGNGCRNSQQYYGAGLWAFGVASVTADDVVLRAEGLPYSTPLTIAQGTEWESGGVGTVFGDGLRCVAGTQIRLVTRLAYAGTALYPEAGQMPVSVRGAIPSAGGTRYYQAIYRNVGEFCTSATFNATNGVEIAWSP